MLLEWDIAAATDRGRVRRRNEDSVLVRHDVRLYAVADGMGGHAAGNVASAIAVATLEAAIPRAPSARISAKSMGKRLQRAFVDANASILARSAARPSEAGMGTTLTALATLRNGPCCVIAHIGDSRAYQYCPGAAAPLIQLTRDHTWVQAQVDAGALSTEEARVHPYSSILMRVLGMDQPGHADVIAVDAAPGHTFLLCSDGLTGMISDDVIAAELSSDAGVQQICANLIALANEAGGRDNISVVVLRARGPK